ncbi:hypothetical protein MTBUT4_90078 [Magnetospirillum sp. UT-4]|nr:hypothetical protein MTBUT4_90078 [Magnetospirillum sp. UT-4]
MGGRGYHAPNPVKNREGKRRPPLAAGGNCTDNRRSSRRAEIFINAGGGRQFRFRFGHRPCRSGAALPGLHHRHGGHAVRPRTGGTAPRDGVPPFPGRPPASAGRHRRADHPVGRRGLRQAHGGAWRGGGADRRDRPRQGGARPSRPPPRPAPPAPHRRPAVQGLRPVQQAQVRGSEILAIDPCRHGGLPMSQPDASGSNPRLASVDNRRSGPRLSGLNFGWQLPPSPACGRGGASASEPG